MSIQTAILRPLTRRSIRPVLCHLVHSVPRPELNPKARNPTATTNQTCFDPPPDNPLHTLLRSQKKISDPHLEALVAAFHLSEPSVEPPVSDDVQSPILNSDTFNTVYLTKPELFGKLSLRSLEAFLRYILASRFDSFTLRLIEELDNDTSVFSTHQRTAIYRILIKLSRTKRQWLTPEDKDFILVSDRAITNYFTRLLKLVESQELLGLRPEDLRCVMRALRRSSSSLFWEANLIRYIWQEITKTESNNNRRSSNARLGIRSILHWVSIPGPVNPQSIISQPTPAIWSLCLQIWTQLLDWGEIIPDDLLPSFSNEINLLSPADLAIFTMLAPIVRSAARRYSDEPLNRDNAKLFKDGCEALEFLLSCGSSTKISSMLEELVPQLVRTFVHAAPLDHRAPAPQICKILKMYPSLQTVSERWSKHGISEQDYRLYGNTLETVHSLGRASLLVGSWLDLLPLINVAQAGWPLSKILTALEELSNPLIRAVSGKPLNGFKFARLVLKVIRELEHETDSRLVPSRRQAFRFLVDRQDLHTFDWLSRDERQFDRDGIELETHSIDSEPMILENVEAIVRLWQSSWGLTKRLTTKADGDPLPLSTLIGVTRLVQRIRNDKTVLLLKMVISRFVADRTPPMTEEEARSKYLHNPKVKLIDVERSKLIESHLTVGGELSRRFLIECFEGFLTEKIVPSVEDLKLLHGFLMEIDLDRGTKFWEDHATHVNGLPWDLFDHSQAYPAGWDYHRIQIAKRVFIDQYHQPSSENQAELNLDLLNNQQE